MSGRLLRALPRLVLFLLFAAALTPIACSVDSTPCYPSDYRACPCVSGVQGFQQCSGTGDGYSACDCSGKVAGGADDAAAPLDATPLDAAADAATKVPFLGSCGSNEECETGLCFSFNAKGQRCTKTCKMDAECPSPSPGCSMMGVCKVS